MSAGSLSVIFFEKVAEVVSLADEYLKLHGHLGFPQKAECLLKSSGLHLHFDLKPILKFVLDKNFSTSQKYPHFEFSDFPLTLASGEHCFLDMYCWRRRPTSIHHHHFVGAFQCMRGQNLDWSYEFRETKRLGDYHSLGHLILKSQHSLYPGDVVPIKWQEDFIHQNLHDDELTINLCLRTHDQSGSYLSDYLFSGLKTIKHPNLIQKVERIYRSLFLSEITLSEIDLSLDESIHFLSQTYHHQSQGVTFLKFRKDLCHQVLNKYGLDVDYLCQQHEIHLNHLE
jgi:hypothetical protein